MSFEFEKRINPSSENLLHLKCPKTNRAAAFIYRLLNQQGLNM